MPPTLTRERVESALADRTDPDLRRPLDELDTILAAADSVERMIVRWLNQNQFADDRGSILVAQLAGDGHEAACDALIAARVSLNCLHDWVACQYPDGSFPQYADALRGFDDPDEPVEVGAA